MIAYEDFIRQSVLPERLEIIVLVSIVLVTLDLKLGFSTFRYFTQEFNGKEATNEISTEL